MKAIETLLAAGFDVRLIHRDGMDMVEAKRTDASTLTSKAAGELVKTLLQNQDEAVEWMREQLKVPWYRLAAGLDGASELDEAIAIHELALWWDGDKCSDGTSHRGHIEKLGIASHAGGAVRLSAPASGRLGRAVHSSEPMALAA
jgi:hypothetical protein